MKKPKRREACCCRGHQPAGGICLGCMLHGYRVARKTRAEERLIRAALRQYTEAEPETQSIYRAARAVAREREKARKP